MNDNAIKIDDAWIAEQQQRAELAASVSLPADVFKALLTRHSAATTALKPFADSGLDQDAEAYRITREAIRAARAALA